VTTGYLLSSTAVTPIGGKLGDRYRRRPMLIGGAAFFLAMTLLCGLAQSMPQLIALRTLQGVGGGVLTATVFAIMGHLLAPVDRARISGLITAVFSLAGGRSGRYEYVHILWWEHVHGPRPRGEDGELLTVDHTCEFGKRCVRPGCKRLLSRGANTEARWERERGG
jgi:Major Facilitator Superfamily